MSKKISALWDGHFMEANQMDSQAIAEANPYKQILLYALRDMHLKFCEELKQLEIKEIE